MLYKFKSKAGADVIMLGAHGDQALQALGRQPAPQGILQERDLVALIATGEAAIAAEQQALAQAQAEAQEHGQRPPSRPEVMLSQRLWPLLDLLRAAQRQGADVVWGV